MNMQLTDAELDVIENTLIDFSGEALDSDVVLYFTDEFLGCSDALVSHGLNRISAWLDGPDGRWLGDARLSATWDDRSCQLALRDGGPAWRVSWGGMPGATTITVERIPNADEAIFLASGTARDGKGAVWRDRKSVV